MTLLSEFEKYWTEDKMEKLTLKRDDYIESCEQLMTISCILGGFSFSGLIALPSMELKLFSKIIMHFQGSLNIAFYGSFYLLFFSTICFLGTILSILVYKACGYFIPLKKLKRIHLISNLIFSFALSSLLMSVIIFGIPTWYGVVGSIICGIMLSGCFIWENLVPWQRKFRLKQMQKEAEKE